VPKPDDDDFPQPAVDLGTPAYFVDVFEPAFGEWRAVQKRTVHVDQPAAAAAQDTIDKFGLFGNVFGVEQGYTGHGFMILLLL
jgi:hypothetical protein